MNEHPPRFAPQNFWPRVLAFVYLCQAVFFTLAYGQLATGIQTYAPLLNQAWARMAAGALVMLSGLFGLAVLYGFVDRSWTFRITRWALGSIFLLAALPKILHPAGFALDISHYGVLPKAGVNMLAVTLPWIELLTALGLLSGLTRRGGLLLVNLLLIVFLAALAQAGLRGLDINCGCFGHGGAAEPLFKALLRDFFFLALAAPAALEEFREPATRPLTQNPLKRS